MTENTSFVTLHSIGRGGNGMVSAVWPDPDAQHPVALKRLQSAARKDQDLVRRFQREVRILRRLDHPNIIQVLDADLQSPDPWFTMPLADQSLKQEIQSGTISESRIEDILTQLLDAMIYAHEKGVIHRDLKPDNVLLFDGNVVVCDFGLGLPLDSQSTRLTSMNFGAGTEGYAAPEQFSDFHNVDERADIYAIGTLIYELCTRRHPISVDLHAVSDKYRRIVARCRETKPDDRYQSCWDLLNALKRIWSPDEDSGSIAEQARDLARAAAHDTTSLDKLISMMVTHVGDNELYMTAVGQLNDTAVSALCSQHQTEVRLILKNYDTVMRNQFPFAWVDRTVDFFAKIFRISDDDVLRERALAILLRMAAICNRFYGGRVFAQIVQSSDQRRDIEIVRDVILANRHQTRWAMDWIDRARVQPSLLRDIDRSVQQAEHDAEALTPDDQELLDYIISREE